MDSQQYRGQRIGGGDFYGANTGDADVSRGRMKRRNSIDEILSTNRLYRNDIDVNNRSENEDGKDAGLGGGVRYRRGGGLKKFGVDRISRSEHESRSVGRSVGIIFCCLWMIRI